MRTTGGLTLGSDDQTSSFRCTSVYRLDDVDDLEGLLAKRIPSDLELNSLPVYPSWPSYYLESVMKQLDSAWEDPHFIVVTCSQVDHNVLVSTVDSQKGLDPLA